MAKIQDIQVKITALSDYVRRRKTIVETVTDALEDNDCLMFESVLSVIDKENTILAVQRLWKDAAAHADDSIRPVRDKIKFVLEGIRYCRDCLRLGPIFRKQVALKRMLFRLKREKILLRDVIALHIFEHPDLAEQDKRILFRHLENSLITQEMQREMSK